MHHWMDIEEKSYKCSVCNSTFFRKDHLKSHLWTHVPKKCSQCNSVFSHIETLEIHLHLQAGKKFPECPLCNAEISPAKEIKEHFQQISARCLHLSPHKNTLCNCSSCSGNQKRCHGTIAGEKSHKNSHCSSNILSVESRKIHLSTHVGEKSHVCSFCKAKFSHSRSLKMHLQIHIDENPFKCSICNSGFSQINILKSHMWTHIPNKCSHYSSSFSHVEALKMHLHLQAGKKLPTCSFCNAEVSLAKEIKHFQQSRTRSPQLSPDKCIHFDSSLTCSCTQKKHHLVNTGKEILKRPHSSSAFSCGGSNNIHKTTDAGGKTHVCSFCKAKFAHSSSLKTHIKIHTGERPYKCSVCDSGFLRADHLNSHLWIHIPNKCPLCNSVFSHVETLEIHLQLQADKLPKCSFCNAEVSQRKVKELQHIKADSLDLSRMELPLIKCEAPEEALDSPFIEWPYKDVLGSNLKTEIKVEEHDLDKEMGFSI